MRHLKHKAMNKLKFWFNNARPISLPQSMLPALTAVALSYSRTDGAQFSWVAAAASLFGVMLLHLGMNLLDDWFDYKKGSAEPRLATSADSAWPEKWRLFLPSDLILYLQASN